MASDRIPNSRSCRTIAGLMSVAVCGMFLTAGCGLLDDDETLPPEKRVAARRLDPPPTAEAAERLADTALGTLRTETDSAHLAEAARTLTALRDTRRVSAVLEAIHAGRGLGAVSSTRSPNYHPPADLSRVYADALREVSDESTIDQLIKCLRDPSPSGPAAADLRRQLASRILIHLADSRSIALLADLLDGAPDDPARGASAEILSALASPGAVDVLIHAVDAADDTRLTSIATALARTRADQAAEALLAKWGTVQTDPGRVTLLAAMLECSDPRIGALACDISASTRSADVRRRAIRLLTVVGGDGALEALQKAAVDPDASVRAAVVQGLFSGPVTRKHPGDAIAISIAALKTDPDPAVRRIAAGTIFYQRFLAPARCIDALVAALNDSDEQVRAAVVASLGVGQEMDPARGDALSIVAAIQRAGGDSSRVVTDAAAKSLATFREAPAVGRSRRLVDSAGRLLGK